jgi:rSAM/selenodomain-associated transferase 1
MSDDNALLIFLKNPQAGNAKTRLAKDVGNKTALAVYLQLLNICAQVSSTITDTNIQLWYADSMPETDFWPTQTPRFLQCAGDLGERMAAAFASSLATQGKVVIIGTDCPTLDHAVLLQAFDALDTHDCVLGPAADGGYYLIGLRAPLPFLFDGIVWSTNKVLADTIHKLETYSLGCFLLPVLRDIDDVDDYRFALGMKWLV